MLLGEVLKNRFSDFYSPALLRKMLTGVFLLFIFLNQTNAQVYLGVMAGPNVGKCVFEHETYKKYHKSEWTPGFIGGFTVSIEKEHKYGLTMQFLYAVKGRTINSTANDFVKNSARYTYLDFPVLFRWYFNQQHYRWYINAGPEISYWLSGKGSMDVYDQGMDEIINYDYLINFGEPKASVDYMNVTDPKRIQINVSFGVGFQWELKHSDFIGVEIKASLGQSFWGPFDGGEIPLISKYDNFEFTNNLISLAVVYVIDPIGKQRHEKK